MGERKSTEEGIQISSLIPPGIKLVKISSSEYMGQNDEYKVYVAEMESSFLIGIDSNSTGVLFSVNRKTGEITNRRKFA